MGITRSMLPKNQGKSPLPLFRGIFWVILHAFIRQNYHKISQIVTLFTHYGKLPYFSLNYHILCTQKNVQNIFFPKKIHEQFIKNGQHPAIFGIEVLI